MERERLTTPPLSEIPDVVDDLKRIKGIGQCMETRLNRSGIFTFSQLASLSPGRISEILTGMIGMSPEKVKEQGWLGQASQLALEAKSDESTKMSATPDDHQRYETFSVKLLVDEDNQVRRTNIVHVQKGAEQNWAGWDEQRLIAFVVKHAALTVTATQITVPRSMESVPSTETNIASSPAGVPQITVRHAHSHHERALMIDKVEVCEKRGVAPPNIIATDQDWSIKLAWTLCGHEPFFGNWLVKVYLESMGPGMEYVLPSDDGAKIALVDGDMKAPNVYSYSNELKFKAGEIAPGIYWLVATIAWEKHPGKLGDLMGFSEKSMLQFYAR